MKNNLEIKQSLLYRLKNQIQGSKTMKLTVQWLGIAMMAFVVFCPRPLQTGTLLLIPGHHWSQQLQSLYWVLSKPLFILGMNLTVLPSLLGFSHSFFTLILTAKPLVYLARISFCTYLVHLFVVYYFLSSRVYDLYFSLVEVFTIYCGLLIISLFFGFALTMAVEIPFANLLKILMNRLKSKEKSKEKKERDESLISTQSLLLSKEENS